MNNISTERNYMTKAAELMQELEPVTEGKTEEVIKELIDTSWSGSNESQMKAVQLLKGIALSDDASANAFMKKLDTFTSGMKAGSSSDDKGDDE